MVDLSDAGQGTSRYVPGDQTAIAGFFSNLLGRRVNVVASEQQDVSAEGTIVAVYSLRGDQADAACVFDICTAASLAVAGSVIRPDILEDAMQRKRIDGVLRQRLHALCELGGGMFAAIPASGIRERLMLIDTFDVEEVPQTVRALLEQPADRRDLQITVAENCSGHIALLTR